MSGSTLRATSSLVKISSYSTCLSRSIRPPCRHLSSTPRCSSSPRPTLPSQLSRLSPPKPQPHLSHILLNDPSSSSSAQAILNDAAARRSNFGAGHLAQITEKQQRRKSVSHQMNHLGNKAADAQKSVAAFLKQNKMKKGPRIKEDEERLRGEAKELSNQMTALRQEHDQLGQDITALLLASPNVSHESAPIGSESQAKVVAVNEGSCHLPTAQASAFRAAQTEANNTQRRGITLEAWDKEVEAARAAAPSQSKESATIRRTHLGLATLLSPSGQIDTPAGRLATGPSFPYLTDSVALLEQALLRYSTDIALAKGYRLVSTPAVVRTDVAERCGFDPRGGEGGQTYFVSSSSSTSSPEENGHPDLCLIGTAEIALAALVSGRTFPRSSLPLRLLAISPSFRAEAGGRGQETKGLYRLHQFMKAEMFVVAAPPSEESGETHPDLLEELRAIQEQVFSSLGLTTRTLLMPTEELGASAHRKYDIEAWMPGRGSDQDGGGWGEVSSASDCTDYQASRLAINVEGVSTPAKEQKKQKPATSTPAHTLNATLLAAPRVIIALMEQYGVDEAGGRLRLPEVLKGYWPGGREMAEEQVEWVGAKAERTSATQSPPSSSFRAAEAGQQTRTYSTSARPTRPPSKESSTDSVPQTGSSSPSSAPSQGKQTLMHKLRSELLVLSQRTGTDPASLTASFLFLHELTAIVPLVALFYLLGLLGAGEAVCQWFLSAAHEGQEKDEVAAWRRKVGEWLNEGIKRTERYARRKGWWGLEKEAGEGQEETQQQQAALITGGGAFANAVAAYVLTKALVAPRLLLSFYLAPAFARRIFEPAKRFVKAWTRRRTK